MRRNFVTKPGLKTDKQGRIYVGRVRAEFSCTEIAKLITEAEKQGYTTECIDDGVLGYGKVILWSPTDGWQNFIIREKYATGWTSTHEVERFYNVYPELQEEIDSCMNKMFEEVTV